MHAQEAKPQLDLNESAVIRPPFSTTQGDTGDDGRSGSLGDVVPRAEYERLLKENQILKNLKKKVKCIVFT